MSQSWALSCHYLTLPFAPYRYVLQDVRGCLSPSYKMSEAAWLHLKNVRGCLAPSYKTSEAAWLRHQFEISQFPWQPLGVSKFRLREVALQPKDLYRSKSRHNLSRNRGGVSGQTFSVSEEAWLRLLSNYSKIFDIITLTCKVF